jgi:hypothetical protein
MNTRTIYRPGILLIGALCLAFGSAAFAQTQNPTQLPGDTAPAAGTAAQTSTAPVPQSRIGIGADTGQVEFFEIRHFSNLTRITGTARDRSFLTGGYNNAVDLNFLQSMTRGVHRFEFVSVGRYTDDQRVDPEHNSLQRAYFRVNAPGYEVNIGDYLVSYTRFTYNQNLKGLHFIKRAPWGAGFRLMGNAGTFTDRYGSLWKDNIFGKPYTRVVSGLRAEQRFSATKQVAFNWGYGNDIVRSIPVDPLTGTQPFVPVHNNVGSFDARMTFFKAWDMQGEAAYSATNPDTRHFGFHRKDYAVRFDNSVRAGRWTFGEYYTRIMPSFYAVNARQVADLQDVLGKAGVQLSNKISFQASYRRTNDDLRERNTRPQTVFQLPEAHMSFRDLPGLGSMLFDVGYRERHQRQAGFASQVTRAPYVEVGIPISSSMVTLGYEHRSYEDHFTKTNETEANDLSASFRSIFNIGNWMFTPLLRYQLNRELFDRVNTGNNNRAIQAGLIIDAPKYFVLEGMYRQVGATLFQDAPQVDPFTLRPVVGANGLPLFSVTGPSGFNRPSLHTAITYKFGNDENRTLAFSYDNNKNWFALPGQNFYERVMQVTVVWRFRRER